MKRGSAVLLVEDGVEVVVVEGLGVEDKYYLDHVLSPHDDDVFGKYFLSFLMFLPRNDYQKNWKRSSLLDETRHNGEIRKTLAVSFAV
jgi:hypothetical protein